jgi:hypothetical protein
MQDMEEAKMIAILNDINELTKKKKALADEMFELIRQLCIVSSEIGELHAALKPVPPCQN